jgi:flagellar M-ring protein FliF
VARAVAQARQQVGSLSRPLRVLLATTVIAASLLVGWLAWRSNVQNWGVLYTQLERDDAAALVNKLKELKIPHRIQNEGTTIEVPEDKVHELRLELASSGLPRGGGVGFEGFDRMRMGATEFEQRVMFRRALEGELARSVSSLGAVQSARVHLVMTERSVFVSRNDPASASVVLRLRPGRHLGPSEVSGIVHLVASSVPSLNANRVTLVTTDGEMLHRPRAEGEGEGDDERGAQHHALEASIEERARAMLERVVGEGHVDVRASIEMDNARVERTEDHYDRDRAALRSEEQTLERLTNSNTIAVAGVPGAESNIGGAPLPAPGGVAGRDGGVLREQHTRNFEIDHVTERRVATQGTVKRLTVAVIVDGIVRTEGGRTRVIPRETAEIERLTTLVRGAVGASADRGDVVTVESIPFIETVEAPVRTAAARPPARPANRNRLYIAGVAAVALALVAVAVLATRRRRGPTVEPAGAVASLPPLVEPLQLDSEATREALRAQVHSRVSSDPATAALVLRYWLGTDAPSQKT